MRSFLYRLGRLMGDVNAVRRGTVGRRIGRRITGRWLGKLPRRLFELARLGAPRATAHAPKLPTVT